MIDMQQKKPAILSFTHQALDRIRAILNDAPKGALGIRFGVKSGGCSGMAYEVTYAMEEKQNDEKITEGDMVIYIDAAATLFLIGSEVDWNQNDLQSSFSFNNPNELSRCGCGESFSI
tara:strand:+ start:110 stop:463 length:354 start_codon:yes stop_codon:yes gene_type:complete